MKDEHVKDAALDVAEDLLVTCHRTSRRTWPSGPGRRVPSSRRHHRRRRRLCAARAEMAVQLGSSVAFGSGGGGFGVARRARAARAPKAKSCATSCGTLLADPPQRPAPRPLRARPSCVTEGQASGGGLASGSPRAAFCPLKGCVRCVLYMLALHVSTATATGPVAPT